MSEEELEMFVTSFLENHHIGDIKDDSIKDSVQAKTKETKRSTGRITDHN